MPAFVLDVKRSSPGPSPAASPAGSRPVAGRPREHPLARRQLAPQTAASGRWAPSAEATSANTSGTRRCGGRRSRLADQPGQAAVGLHPGVVFSVGTARVRRPAAVSTMVVAVDLRAAPVERTRRCRRRGNSKVGSPHRRERPGDAQVGPGQLGVLAQPLLLEHGVGEQEVLGLRSDRPAIAPRRAGRRSRPARTPRRWPSRCASRCRRPPRRRAPAAAGPSPRSAPGSFAGTRTTAAAARPSRRSPSP